VALRAVVFDVGETLFDETGIWERAADRAGVPPFTLMGVLGGLAARREHHDRVWEVLGVEAMLREHVDVVGSGARWGVEKPAAEFFDRVVEEAGFEAEEIAYVGDRVDNDVNPALAAGMVAVHVRRGPWGHLHEPPPEAIGVRSLAELPEALARV
jgi:FMN phosphatase YigB (HAD superfamily)